MAVIEKMYMVESERGMMTDLLTDEIIPELLINMFMVEFNMDRKKCLERIKDQDDRKELFDSSNEF